MKISFILSLCFLFVTGFSTAQKGVQGIFTYKASISLPDTNVVIKSWNVTVYTNDTVVRVETQTDAVGEQVFIRHMELDKAYLLLNFNGEKFAIQTNLAENRVKQDSTGTGYTFDRKLFGGKKIGGVKAKRYYVQDNGQPDGYYCWFAKSIPNKYLEVYRDIPGLAVDYFLPSQEGLIRYELVDFKEGPVSRDYFGVPSDYKRITFEEFVNTYSGN